MTRLLRSGLSGLLCWSLFLVPLLVATLSSAEKQEAGKKKWIQLFNGKDLSGWKVKIKGHALGDNFGKTFRGEGGVLKVGYDAYKGFGRKFGHLFYEKPFSHYIIRCEYRFTGKQVAGGPGWAFRNSGIMVHGQSPESMGKDQNFPVSIEVQLLGGRAKGKRSTANLCTPGTHVFYKGKLHKPHCTNSVSKTYRGDQWVTVDLGQRRWVRSAAATYKTSDRPIDPASVRAFFGDGGPAREALLSQPPQSALGPDGTLYVLDQRNQRIRRIDADKIITTAVGDGTAGFAGDGGSPLNAQLQFPAGANPQPAGGLAFDLQFDAGEHIGNHFTNIAEHLLEHGKCFAFVFVQDHVAHRRAS